MAWKLSVPLKIVVLNAMGVAAFLFLIVELGRTENGRDVLGFFILPAAVILIIDVVFMVLHLVWTSAREKLHRGK